jgi:hypothetical protein
MLTAVRVDFTAELTRRASGFDRRAATLPEG